MPEIYLIVDEDSAYLWHRKGTSLNPLFCHALGKIFIFCQLMVFPPLMAKEKDFITPDFHIILRVQTKHHTRHFTLHIKKGERKFPFAFFEMNVRSVQLVRTCVAIPTSGQHISVVIDVHAFSGTLSFIPTPHPEIFVFPDIYTVSSGFSFVSLTDVIISVVI